MREENDTEWEARIERKNSGPNFSGENQGRQGKEITIRRESRDSDEIPNFKDNLVRESGGIILKDGSNRFERLQFGPEIEEDNGLMLEDRKRRSGALINETMDTKGGLKTLEFTENTGLPQGAVFSDSDFSATTQKDLATLAEQASHSS